MTNDRNLPAPTGEPTDPAVASRPAVAPDRPLSVAFLPLALVAFVILAFIIAAWTFLAAAA